MNCHLQNPDYDVELLTENGKLSPGLGSVALAISATAKRPHIQLAEEGQANPKIARIRKALVELVGEVKGVEDSPRRLAFLPHATLVGWISDKEILT